MITLYRLTATMIGGTAHENKVNLSNDLIYHFEGYQ